MGEGPGIKAVLDTNVVVSAVRHGSVTRQVAEAWYQRRFHWLVSQEILDEYIRVLAYPKFRLDQHEILVVLNKAILPYTQVVRVRSQVRVAPDPSDNKFLACAVDGQADYLVSGDHRLLAVERYRRVQVVGVAEFLHVLAS